MGRFELAASSSSDCRPPRAACLLPRPPPRFLHLPPPCRPNHRPQNPLHSLELSVSHSCTQRSSVLGECRSTSRCASRSASASSTATSTRRCAASPSLFVASPLSRFATTHGAKRENVLTLQSVSESLVGHAPCPPATSTALSQSSTHYTAHPLADSKCDTPPPPPPAGVRRARGARGPAARDAPVRVLGPGGRSASRGGSNGSMLDHPAQREAVRGPGGCTAFCGGSNSRMLTPPGSAAGGSSPRSTARSSRT